MYQSGAARWCSDQHGPHSQQVLGVELACATCVMWVPSGDSSSLHKFFDPILREMNKKRDVYGNVRERGSKTWP